MVNYSKDNEFYDQATNCSVPQVKRDKTNVAIRTDEWKSLANSITYLFHHKQLQRLELDILNEKVRNVLVSRETETIVECYKDSILKKGIFSISFQSVINGM